MPKALTISNRSQLLVALDKMRNGDLRDIETLFLAGGHYGTLVLRGNLSKPQGPAPHDLVIRAQDPTHPVIFDSVDLCDMVQITLDGLTFLQDDTCAQKAFAPFFNIQDSTGITICNAVFKGTLDPSKPKISDAFGVGLMMDGCHKIGLLNCQISHFDRGIIGVASQDIVVEGNELHTIGSTGIEFSGLHRIRVKDNHLHSFWHAPTSIDPPQLIHFRTGHKTRTNSAVTICGNRLDIGTGSPARSILVSSDTDHPACNGLTVASNFITNSDFHGIVIDPAEQVILRSNLLLYANPRQSLPLDGADVPRIMIAPAAADVVLEENIAPQSTFEHSASDWHARDNAWFDPNDTDMMQRCHAEFVNKMPLPDLQNHPEIVNGAHMTYAREINPPTAPVTVISPQISCETKTKIPFADVKGALAANGFRITTTLKANTQWPGSELLRLHRSFVLSMDDEGDLHLQVFCIGRKIIEISTQSANLCDREAHILEIEARNGICQMIIDHQIVAQEPMPAALNVSGTHDIVFTDHALQNFDALAAGFSITAIQGAALPDSLNEAVYRVMMGTPAPNLGDSFVFHTS